MSRISSWLSPPVIFPAYAFSLLALMLAGFFPKPQPDYGAREWVLMLHAVIGYGVALIICLSVASEHRSDSWFRFAWLAFALNAAASVVRHAADTSLWDLVWPGYSSGVDIAIIRQTAIVIGLGALLTGLIAIVWAFHRMGIGLSPKRWDILSICGVLAVLAVIFNFREGLAEFRKASVLAQNLQQLGLILVAMGAACSILVYRLAREMSGGRLALTMLSVVIYTVLRCLLVCISLFPLAGNFLRPVTIPLAMAVPWLFALAAAYRKGIASHGAAQIPQSSPVSSYVRQTLRAQTRIS
jgi:hypothetical protein